MISYIGIDLGLKGAICVQSKLAFHKPTFSLYPFWDRFGGTRLRTILEEELVTLLEGIVNKSGESFVTIEHPIFLPGKSPQKVIASMHEKFGVMKGILLTLGVQGMWFPKPMQWKKVTGTPGSDKDKMFQYARRIMNHEHLNAITADAVLISEACRIHFQ
jgi:hypothetical protein